MYLIKITIKRTTMETVTTTIKVKPAMKAASKFLQKIFHTDNDAEAMECVAQVVMAEAEENTDFFISSLDEVIKFCEKLKKDVWNESKSNGRH